MRYMLELLKPVTTEGKRSGSERRSYEKFRTVHAERVRVVSSYRQEAGESFPDYNVRYNIRDAHPVKEQWQVREVGGCLYTVTNIEYNKNAGMQTLVCERVNQ